MVTSETTMAKKEQKNTEQIKVSFISLGCPKNTVDSERMLAEIVQAGFLLASEPQDSDVVVINTCGFIEPAKLEAIETIKAAVELKNIAVVKKVIAVGCLAERMAGELLKVVEGLDAVSGLDYRDDICQVIKQTLKLKDGEQLNFNQETAGNNTDSDIEKPSHAISDDSCRLLITPAHSAYLRISEGCDHKCSFCTIPAIRGPFRSKPQEQIIKEARELAKAGVVELNLIAQDSGYYGKDFGIKNALPALLKELEKIDGIHWIRLMYMYPAGLTDEVIEAIAESKKIVKYIDMPIQHINDEVLKNMRRPDRSSQIKSLIEKLRNKIPEIVIRTTVIVGFPEETDEQFGQLIDFVKWAKFEALGAFSYCKEPETEAAKMECQINDDVKNFRRDKLMATQQHVAFKKAKKMVGRKLKVLIDLVDQNGFSARYYGQAMDVDGICIWGQNQVEAQAKTGEFKNVKVTAAKGYDLIVELIGE